jgi:hypothetical protein
MERNDLQYFREFDKFIKTFAPQPFNDTLVSLSLSLQFHTHTMDDDDVYFSIPPLFSSRHKCVWLSVCILLRSLAHVNHTQQQ